MRGVRNLAVVGIYDEDAERRREERAEEKRGSLEGGFP